MIISIVIIKALLCARHFTKQALTHFIITIIIPSSRSLSKIKAFKVMQLGSGGLKPRPDKCSSRAFCMMLQFCLSIETVNALRCWAVSF